MEAYFIVTLGTASEPASWGTAYEGGHRPQWLIRRFGTVQEPSVDFVVL